MGKNTFEYRESRIPQVNIEAGEVLLKTLYLSFDLAMRGWMYDKPSYIPPAAIGEPIRTLGIGPVISSGRTDFTEDNLMTGLLSWQ
jgi:NADPH-dependent curcumin reductase CurA